MAQMPASRQVQQHSLESPREATQVWRPEKEVGYSVQQSGRKFRSVDLRLHEGVFQGLQEKWGAVRHGDLAEEALEQPQVETIMSHIARSPTV